MANVATVSRIRAAVFVLNIVTWTLSHVNGEGRQFRSETETLENRTINSNLNTNPNLLLVVQINVRLFYFQNDLELNIAEGTEEMTI